MRTYYVYILLCADQSYYVGVTNNLGRRFIEHATSRNPGSYTSKRLPVMVVYAEQFRNPFPAILREKQLKKWTRKKKEALIAGKPDDLKAFSKKKNFNRIPITK
ncbi:MAG: GIY-YIG nuclease family protein [Flavobacteriia bacterium]|nr:GIY-YIG nuclease family protein [Flavobacteriia bacterium]